MAAAGSGSLESLRERNRRQLVDTLRRRGSAEPRRPRPPDRALALHGLDARRRPADRRPRRRARARADARAPQQGRPPTLLTLDRSAGLVLGIDFGHEHVHVAIADLSRTILAERVRELDVDHSAKRALDVAVELADEVIAAAGVDGDRILGVGVALSGPIDIDDGHRARRQDPARAGPACGPSTSSPRGSACRCTSTTTRTSARSRRSRSAPASARATRST